MSILSDQQSGLQTSAYRRRQLPTPGGCGRRLRPAGVARVARLPPSPPERDGGGRARPRLQQRVPPARAARRRALVGQVRRQRLPRHVVHPARRGQRRVRRPPAPAPQAAPLPRLRVRGRGAARALPPPAHRPAPLALALPRVRAHGGLHVARALALALPAARGAAARAPFAPAPAAPAPAAAAAAGAAAAEQRRGRRVHGRQLAGRAAARRVLRAEGVRGRGAVAAAAAAGALLAAQRLPQVEPEQAERGAARLRAAQDVQLHLQRGGGGRLAPSRRPADALVPEAQDAQRRGRRLPLALARALRHRRGRAGGGGRQPAGAPEAAVRAGAAADARALAGGGGCADAAHAALADAGRHPAAQLVVRG